MRVEVEGEVESPSPRIPADACQASYRGEPQRWYSHGSNHTVIWMGVFISEIFCLIENV